MTSDSRGLPKSLLERVKRFAERPWREKVQRIRSRWVEKFPRIPVPLRLPFGVWWLARNDHVSGPMIHGEFENAELSFVRRFVRPGMTVLDIGAHHGLYTLLSSRLAGPTGRVFAFEPSPRERKALLRHVKLNGCKNVRVQALALGDADKKAELYVVDSAESGCNSLRPPAVTTATSPVSVQVVPLDGWLAEQGIERVDFIKLDVEGGELDVLRGAVKLLERAPRPVILAEVQDVRTRAWGYKARETIDYLASEGYEWLALLKDGTTAALDISAEEFDGNFIACPRESKAELSRRRIP
jgi:FkbM family methyltransferase